MRVGDCEGDEGRVGVGEGGRVGGSVGSSSSTPVEKEKKYVTCTEQKTSFPNLTCTQLVFVIFKPQMVLITILVRCTSLSNQIFELE